MTEKKEKIKVDRDGVPDGAPRFNRPGASCPGCGVDEWFFKRHSGNYLVCTVCGQLVHITVTRKRNGANNSTV